MCVCVCVWGGDVKLGWGGCTLYLFCAIVYVSLTLFVVSLFSVGFVWLVCLFSCALIKLFTCNGDLYI